METIEYFNRYTSQIETEKVYGDKLIRWLYQTPSGQKLSHLLAKASLSKAYGKWQDTRYSAKKIKPFIQNFSIPIDDFLVHEKEQNLYPNFNQFFIREFKKGKRNFPTEEKQLGAFAEGRYFAWESIEPDQTFPVKGSFLSAQALLDNEKWAPYFEGGPLLLCRLCPVDYHRFHFPDSGQFLDHYRVKGPYHSVNPIALAFQGDILSTNERQVSILETKHFGKLAYIEVGAMCVGKIVQSQGCQGSFSRGDQKGYFLFGGSTVIVLGEKNRLTIDADLREHTLNQREVFVKLGDHLAQGK